MARAWVFSPMFLALATASLPGCYCAHLPSRYTYGDDAGTDASPSDSGVRDGGAVDAAVQDAETAADAGDDADVDGGPIDAGTDAGFDCAPCTWGCAPTAPRCAALIEIRAGGNHSCVRSESGGVWCWGRNTSGELGDGSRVNRPRPTRVIGIVDAVQLAAGYSHTCARHADGRLTCWGNGANGRLGLGDAAPSSVVVPTTVAGLEAAHIAAGLDATCAVTTSGEVRCWGNNANGQLGLDLATPALNEPSGVVPGVDARSVSVGSAHACAVTRTRGVVCWGRDVEGQVGNGPGDADPVLGPARVALTGIVDVTAGAQHTCARDDAGEGYCWGMGTDGRLGDGRRMSSPAPVVVSRPGAEPWLQVVAGNITTAGRTGARTWSWGGGVALGTEGSSRGSPGFIDPPLTTASDIALGSGHGCALASDGRAMCWGANADGQLGDGSGALSWSPVVVLDPE